MTEPSQTVVCRHDSSGEYALRRVALLAVLGAGALFFFAEVYTWRGTALLDRLDGNVGEVLMKQGLTYENAGDREPAKERYLAALSSKFQGEQNRAFTLKHLGVLYWNDGAFETALPYLQESAASPQAPITVFEPLCDTLYQLNRFDDAAPIAEAWLQAAKDDPRQQAAALYHQGRLALARKDRTAAIAKYQASDALIPGDRAASDLSSLYYEEGRYQEALTLTDRYLQNGAGGNRAEYMRQLRARIAEKLAQSKAQTVQ